MISENVVVFCENVVTGQLRQTAGNNHWLDCCLLVDGFTTPVLL